jgi:hypothetical protein
MGSAGAIIHLVQILQESFASPSTVFDLPKHRLDDGFALRVNRLGSGRLHFAVHVLP